MHAAIFSCPVPALAHPTFSLVAALLRRGWRISYVTSERFASEAAALGAEVLRCPRIDAPFDQDDTDAMPIECQYVRDFATLAARTFALTLPFYEKNRPELVIYDAVAFAGPLVADKIGVPSVRMSNQFDFSGQTFAQGQIPANWQDFLVDLDRQASELFALHRSVRRDVLLRNGDPTFYFYPRELQLNGSLQTGGVCYAPRCMAERPNISPWKRPTARARPSALFSTSTTYGQDSQYYKKCLAALSQLGWETFVAVGSNSTVADYHSLPPSCHLIHGAPLFAVMPSVDVMICAAGMATAMEALYHGVPMLMLSSGYTELASYAQMFHSRGLGIHLNHANASPENVARHAERMSRNAELRIKLQQMQRMLRRSAGAEEVANWLEEKVQPGHPSASS